MLCEKESIILRKIQINNSTVEYFFDVSQGLKKYFRTNRMFIEYTNDIKLESIPKSILVIPFVASVLPLMWLTDSIMWIEEIDKTFYRSLNRVKRSYQEMYDYYPLKGSLIPAKIIDNSFIPQKESLVLFSGGLDAQTTYLRNIKTNPLLFNIQGWYKENTDEINSVADKDIKDIYAFSQREKVNFRFAKSNFATLIENQTFHKNIEKKLKDNWWHGFQHSMAFISIATVAAYYYKIRTIYIASSFAIGDTGRCASYPTTDSEFEFAGAGEVCHDGFELTRQDKVHLIVEHQKNINNPYPLKVCTFNDDNCLICEKCVRTMLGIIAENGDINNFGFNVTKPLLQHFKTLFEENIVFFDVKGESTKHWVHIKKRMRENYNNLSEKELVDWFLNEDLINIRKKEILKYRIKNFRKLILKRILKNRNM